MKKIGLVLEGGGMRGLYTAGVLDFFMDKDIYFPYTIGVSAGACNGTSYISRQKGRSKRINLDYINDPRYLSYRNLIKEGSLFGMDFLFNQIPYNLIPFDFDTFYNSKEQFVVGTTDCSTGKPVYFNKEDCKSSGELLNIVKASSSLPFGAPIVNIGNRSLLDGGIADSIPIRKSIADGFERNVVVLTRNSDYRKKPSKLARFAKLKYSKYRGLIGALRNRHNNYNDTLDYIDKLEKENKVFVIRPTEPLNVDRLEKDYQRLSNLYDLGYADAANCYDKLTAWL